jgi:hypothetical protein
MPRPPSTGRRACQTLALAAMTLTACGSAAAPVSHSAGPPAWPRQQAAADTARHAAALAAPASGRAVVFRSPASIPSGANVRVIVRQDGHKLTERRFALCARAYENTHVRAVMGACPANETATARLVFAVRSLDHRAHRVTVTYQVGASG